MLSKQRDMAAAKQFFQQAKEVTGCRPERVTIDGHDSYPGPYAEYLGARWSSEPTATSITVWNKTIGA
jgi:transposase-like protein